MRGEADPQPSMFSYVDLESRIPKTHPIRKIRKIVDRGLVELEPTFEAMYSDRGRPSIPPEQLIRALLLQIFFTIRSERQLMERIDYDLLFRWFVGLSMDDPVWNHSVFSKNRDRLMAYDVDEQLFEAIKQQGYAKKLLSRDHFTVDGTLIEACASLKSFKPKDSDDDSDDGENFHGQKRSNATHASTTDPDSRLFRKGMGKEAKLNYMGHVVTENRNGLIVEAKVTEAADEPGVGCRGRSSGNVRSKASSSDGGGGQGLRCRSIRRCRCRELGITRRTWRPKRSAVGSMVARRVIEGYEISQRKRKQVEEPFGWMKSGWIDAQAASSRTGAIVDWQFRFTACAFNIIRLKSLLA